MGGSLASHGPWRPPGGPIKSPKELRLFWRPGSPGGLGRAEEKSKLAAVARARTGSIAAPLYGSDVLPPAGELASERASVRLRTGNATRRLAVWASALRASVNCTGAALAVHQLAPFRPTVYCSRPARRQASLSLFSPPAGPPPAGPRLRLGSAAETSGPEGAATQRAHLRLLCKPRACRVGDLWRPNERLFLRRIAPPGHLLARKRALKGPTWTNRRSRKSMERVLDLGARSIGRDCVGRVCAIGPVVSVAMFVCGSSVCGGGPA